jgi:hypothetical protein
MMGDDGLAPNRPRPMGRAIHEHDTRATACTFRNGSMQATRALSLDIGTG